MNLMEQFDKLTTQRAELRAWCAMGDKNTHNGTKYTLRVDFVNPSLIAFCGQERPGSNNYHEAPKMLAAEIANVLHGMQSAVVSSACITLLCKLDAEIAQLKDQILAELGCKELAI